MKTSNKLLVAAVALVLGTFVTYDVALRAEYLTGSYKEPLRNYQALGLRNFDKIVLPAAGAIKVKIMAGPFAVHVNKEAVDYVRVVQHGEQLTVSLAYPKEWEWVNKEAVIISCPRLAALTTEGTYTVAGRPQLDKLKAGGEVEVKGFRQDSLTLRQSQSSHIVLADNTLGWLQAVVGTRPSSESDLSINVGNHIQAGDLTIAHRGHLTLATAIPQLHYQFSDSASVVLTGAAARSLAAAK